MFKKNYADCLEDMLQAGKDIQKTLEKMLEDIDSDI